MSTERAVEALQAEFDRAAEAGLMPDALRRWLLRHVPDITGRALGGAGLVVVGADEWERRRPRHTVKCGRCGWIDELASHEQVVEALDRHRHQCPVPHRGGDTDG